MATNTAMSTTGGQQMIQQTADRDRVDHLHTIVTATSGLRVAAITAVRRVS